MLSIEKMEKQLQLILSSMDVPEIRQDLSRLANVRWLQRNLGVRNGGHPQLKECFAMLRLLAKELR